MAPKFVGQKVAKDERRKRRGDFTHNAELFTNSVIAVEGDCEQIVPRAHIERCRSRGSGQALTLPRPCSSSQAARSAPRAVVLPVPAAPTTRSATRPDVATCSTASTWSVPSE